MLLKSLSLASLVPVLAFATGCQKIHSDDDDGIRAESRATPFDYRLDDPACQATNGSPSIGAQRIFVWDDGHSSEATLDVPVNGQSSTSSSLIDSTYYGFKMTTTKACTIEADGSASCDDGDTTVTQKEANLKLCRASGTYSRDSLESVTLSSIQNLEHAKTVYSRLTGSKALKKVSLLVMPDFQTIYDVTNKQTNDRYKRILSDTDNAAFAAGKDDDGSDFLFFVVYPRSIEQTKKAGWEDVRFWEVPWVMAHEFSHQIFFTHYAKYRTDTNDDESTDILAKSLGGIWKRKLDVPREESGGFGLADLGAKASALSAVNEGFADLLGAQMLDGKKDHAKNLPCFAATRDFTSATFADGKDKILTAEVRDTFFSTDEEDVDGDCGTSFQDPHHIGAIVAYGVNKILMDGLAADASIDERSARVLAWIDNFSAERNKVTSVTGEDLWVLAVKAALITAQGPSETLLASQCATAKSVFPFAEDTLFSPTGFICAN